MSRSLLAALLAVLLLEAIFRVRARVLPSLSALWSPEAVERWGQDSPPIATPRSASSTWQAPHPCERAHVAPPVQRHAVGGSIAWTPGLQPHEAWGVVLANALAGPVEKILLR